MEHRYATRFDITFDAWVRCRDGLILYGKTRDVSVDGSFIDLSKCRLSHNSIVEVTMSKDGKIYERHMSIVVHTRSEGVGFMFEVSSKTLNERALKAISRPMPVRPLRAYVGEGALAALPKGDFMPQLVIEDARM